MKLKILITGGNGNIAKLIKKNFKTLTYPVKSIKTLDCENDIITFTL